MQNLFRSVPILGSVLQIAAAAICGAPCAILAAAFVTGVTSGNLGLALRAGFIAAVTAGAFNAIGDLTGGLPGAPGGGHAPLDFLSEAHLFNIAGHALVGCGSAVASGGRCGPGALSGAAGSFAGPLLTGLASETKLVATSVVGGLASVAGGGKFANGALTAAFGYLFNDLALIWGHTRADSWNFAGHVGVAIEGFGMYSYGNNTPLGSNATDYAGSQSQDRDQTVITIPTTPDQDKAAFEYLQQFTEKNDVGWIDNCACRVQGALEAAGIRPDPWTLWPVLPVDAALQAAGAPGATGTFIPRGAAPLDLTRFNPSPWP